MRHELVNGQHPGFWSANDAWREARLSHLSRDARQWIDRGTAEAERAGGYRAGNRVVAVASSGLRSAATAYDEDAIASRARTSAHHCALSTAESAIGYAEAMGLRLPAGPSVTRAGLHARLKDDGYWRRQLRKLHGRRAEGAFRDLGRVHRHADPYITNDGLQRHFQQRARAADFLATHDALCLDTGELLPLDDIASHSLACETIRRGEFMARTRGLEEYAQAAGHAWAFFTLTAPSAYHARLVSGAPNPAYRGASVRDARDLLQKLWSRVRSKAKRLRLVLYGMRVAEPHHDATPHWHIIMFGPPADLERLWWCIQGHWYSVNREELTSDAAREARAQRKLPDPTKGESAAGYIAKYIAKGIDGHALATDDAAETDLSGADASARVVAWARLHGIRQFQQIGGPRVGIYRELRRVREPIDEPTLEAARLAADGGRYSEFWTRSGGISLDKEPPRAIDRAGRTVLNLTAWGEVPADRTVGVSCIGHCERIKRVRTRLYTWRIERCAGTSASSSVGGNSRTGGCTGGARITAHVTREIAGTPGIGSASARASALRSDLGPVAITVRGAPAAGDALGWTNPQETSRAGPPRH